MQDKMGKNGNAAFYPVAVTIIGLALVIGLAFYMESLPMDEAPEEIVEDYQSDKIFESLSFIEEDPYAPNHWDHMPLTYEIVDEEDCYSLRVRRIGQAVDEIEKWTNKGVRFEKVAEGADISFFCSKFGKFDAGYETLGEAESTYEGNIIVHSDIYLYGGFEEGCREFPDTEMHEIIHALGVQEHSLNAGSVISKLQHYCLQEITPIVDGELFAQLEEIYSKY